MTSEEPVKWFEYEAEPETFDCVTEGAPLLLPNASASRACKVETIRKGALILARKQGFT